MSGSLSRTAREQIAGTEQIQKCRFLRGASRLLYLFHNFLLTIYVITIFVKTYTRLLMDVQNSGGDLQVVDKFGVPDGI